MSVLHCTSRRYVRCRLGQIALMGLLAGCPSAEEPPPPDPDLREACADTDPLRNLYWGDLHVHTAWSFDAWYEGIRTTPEQAYDFARGAPLDLGFGPELRLERPLDFAAVTDHAEFLAEISLCAAEDATSWDDPWCADLREMSGTEAVQRLGTQNSLEDPTRFEICDSYDCRELAMDVWQRLQRAADEAYDKTASCSFTTFVGYEWTGTTDISNIHRNVIFAGAVVPDYPTSYFEAPSEVQLWRELEQNCLEAGDGCDVLAIPHNANLSNGTMFVPDVPPGYDPAELARLRADLEPLVELIQHKGDAECIPGVSGILGAEDELCSFEKMQLPPINDCGEGTGSGAMIGIGCTSRTDYLRGTLLEGLVQRRQLGVNPYRLGVIGSTDTHLGTPGFVDERSYVGHTGAPEDSPAERLADPNLRPVGLLTNPGGLMAVWSEANERGALFDAMRRRETYATSGPRIALRFFGGWDYSEEICEAADLVERGYASGVPMGGVLPESGENAGDGEAPVFVVQAFADVGTESVPGVDLERVQIVKGWIDELGQRHEQVHDLALDSSEKGVDLSTCLPHGQGASSFCVRWQDPDYQPGQEAFWYARVLENPTCRWSAWQCLEIPEQERPAGCTDPAVPWTIQERAWSSPIWSSGGAG